MNDAPMGADRDASRWVPPTIPTMVTIGELRFLRALTARGWNGMDDVLEVGPWLGATTAALASGMSGRARGGHLHVLDTFIWRRFMGERSPVVLDEGASFREHFASNLRPWSSLLRIHEARLPDDRESDFEFEEPVLEYGERLPVFRGDWIDRPLGALFVDGAKSWTGFGHLLTETGPRMVPNRTVIVAQDYRYWAAYWVPAGLELVRGLELIPSPAENSIAFLVRDPAVAKWPASAYDVDVVGLLNRAAARLDQVGDEFGAAIVRLGEIPYRANRGDSDGAVSAYLRSERKWGLWPAENLVRARRWLATRADIPPTLRWRAIEVMHLGRRIARRIGRQR